MTDLFLILIAITILLLAIILIAAYKLLLLPDSQTTIKKLSTKQTKQPQANQQSSDNKVLQEQKHPEQPANNFYENAIICFEAANYDRVISYLTEAISYNGNQSKYYFTRGCAYYYKLDYSAAVDDFSKTLALNPSDYIALYNRGLSYLNMQLYENSIDSITQAILTKPGMIDFHYYLALCYYKTRKYQDAKEQIATCLCLTKTNKTLFNLLIMITICEIFKL